MRRQQAEPNQIYYYVFTEHYYQQIDALIGVSSLELAAGSLQLGPLAAAGELVPMVRVKLTSWYLVTNGASNLIYGQG
jgi:hypothetical protein